MHAPSSSDPASTELHSICEDCIEDLNRLMHIHLTMDPPHRAIQPSEPDCTFRLRKALLHVQAIIGWEITVEIMHVMAPEIRAALGQLDEIQRETGETAGLDGILGRGSRSAKQRSKPIHEFTSSYVHSSPQTLLLPLEEGGLVPGDSYRCYAYMANSLLHLASGYAVSLAFLSQRATAGQETAIAEVARRTTTAMNQVLSIIRKRSV